MTRDPGIEMTANHLTISSLQAAGFEEIWETSRRNSFSWGYPATILCGGIILALLSLIPGSSVRRILKVVTILGFGLIALDFSAREIAEKWRLRHEWADDHGEQMTEAQRESLYADGANLTLGPLIDGVRAFGSLIGVAAVLFFTRRLVEERRLKNVRTHHFGEHHS